MSRYIFTIIFILLSSTAYAEEIIYEIYSYTDNPKGTLISKGVKKYAFKDITVVEKEYKGEKHWSKSLELDNGFFIGASIYREARITGFGLKAIGAPCGFSWEWFNESAPGKFDKLQEGGAISVKYYELGGLKEIVEIHFDSDISLRLNETRKTIGGITHRILVKKGSVLKFSPNNAFQRTAALSRPCR
ncbi:MAG: hypothetical protein ACC641_07170 [Acidiferrobacterales bacterium]